MKQCLTLLLALLLVCSALLTTSCARLLPGSSSANDDNEQNKNEQTEKGNPYDGGYYTITVPKGMMKISEGGGMALFMNISTQETLVIQDTRYEATLNEDGTVDYSEFREMFSEQAMRDAFAGQGNNYPITTEAYTELIPNRLYKLDFEAVSPAELGKTVKPVVIVALSPLNENNEITITVMVYIGENTSGTVDDLITPVFN